ncbi:DUF1835 domain-containing protein [Flavobacteriaceae bacterium S356]|uniref:DUF1835 domain-containing protein n=1 Tax=Asprobacillus argus TaxID=3076534 RepID=A0ABU3LG43_9FLAO|nr:DUF1835 domain-containing protein [Flavobacteriaceae bacterium S356]
MNKVLHITNGDSLTDYLNELGFQGDFLTWQEMLCEGPVISNINSKKFFDIRSSFLKEYYDIEVNKFDFNRDLIKLEHTENYDAIILWFEYDLFCHINMLGVISLLHQKKIDKPIYLVTSGFISGEKSLKGLPELNPDQLREHFHARIKLTKEDQELAVDLWNIYCGMDHNLFKPYIVSNSSFKYMSNCLKAHIERFPNQKTGLSVLEENILTIVKDRDVKSKHHLLGYILNYQGYYGFGDLQMERIIEKLSIFFKSSTEKLELNRNGHEALLGQHNFAREVKNNMIYGGVQRLNYQFNSEKNKLIKTILNVY